MNRYAWEFIGGLYMIAGIVAFMAFAQLPNSFPQVSALFLAVLSVSYGNIKIFEAAKQVDGD